MRAMRAGLFALVAITCWAPACKTPVEVDPVPVAATALAIDPNTVEITFTAVIDASSAGAAALEVFAPLVRPIESLAIEGREVDNARLVLKTARQTGGRLYSVKLTGLRFEGIEVADAPEQVNFQGFGHGSVRISLDTRGTIVPGALRSEITVDPQSGRWVPDYRGVPLSDEDGDGVHSATVAVQITPDKTFAARAVGPDGAEAGGLVSFTVTSTRPVRIELPPRLRRVPEFTAPVDPRPGDGFAPVRIVLDDRPARALARPSIKLTLSPDGRFDRASTRLERAQPVAGKPRVYEIVVNVAVDPARRLDGDTDETFPYIAYLFDGGRDIPQRGANFIMPAEQPQVLVVLIGNPELVPVTFRVDAGKAVLEPDQSVLGKYPGEGIFLTGELSGAEDALGEIAGDAFSGGERATLEMKERPDAPGIYEKTIFLPPNRPYGWKVVRCPSGVGCAELNRHVVSSGRAFPTVMKNLVTQNVDAAGSTAVRVIDPSNLAAVVLEDGRTLDYSRARVSMNGMEMGPDATIMFKQEAPDLVVTVGTQPVITPTWVVGTWRDINIPEKPSEIISGDLTLNLSPFDYDDGLEGRPALERVRDLPIDPGEVTRPAGDPPFAPTDGMADAAATQVLAPAGGRLPVWVGWNGRDLYVATQAAQPGRDVFVMIALDEPVSALRAQWAKAGTTVAGTRTIFLAMEGDGMFQGWFTRGRAGNDDMQLMGAGATAGAGAVLEGVIDPARFMGLGAIGGRIWVAAIAYGTADGGALDPATQSPAGNGDGNVDATEMVVVDLAEIRAQ